MLGLSPLGLSPLALFTPFGLPTYGMELPIFRTGLLCTLLILCGNALTRGVLPLISQAPLNPVRLTIDISHQRHLGNNGVPYQTSIFKIYFSIITE
jgi:hypothetical protein